MRLRPLSIAGRGAESRESSSPFPHRRRHDVTDRPGPLGPQHLQHQLCEDSPNETQLPPGRLQLAAVHRLNQHNTHSVTPHRSYNTPPNLRGTLETPERTLRKR